jgi:hypothetical protein
MVTVNELEARAYELRQRIDAAQKVQAQATERKLQEELEIVLLALVGLRTGGLR